MSYQVVVSFRLELMTTPMDRWLSELPEAIRLWADDCGTIGLGSLDIAVREIGAAGESSEVEGEGP